MRDARTAAAALFLTGAAFLTAALFCVAAFFTDGFARFITAFRAFAGVVLRARTVVFFFAAFFVAVVFFFAVAILTSCSLFVGVVSYFLLLASLCALREGFLQGTA